MICELFKTISSSLVITAAVLILSASCCEDNRPPITEKYPEKGELRIDAPIFLRYNLTTFIEKCREKGYVIPDLDIQELSDYNNMVPAGSSWLDFYTLFKKTETFPGTRPEVKFLFSAPDCKDAITVSYHAFDSDLCENKVIKNAPKINSNHWIDFSARTIKTSHSGISVKWSKQFSMTGVGVEMVIDLPGTVEYPFYVFTTSTKGGNQAAARIDGQRVDLVQNTVDQEFVVAGTVSVIIVDDSPIVSPIMKQSVCVGGVLDDKVKWDTPVIVELDKL